MLTAIHYLLYLLYIIFSPSLSQAVHGSDLVSSWDKPNSEWSVRHKTCRLPQLITKCIRWLARIAHNFGYLHTPPLGGGTTSPHTHPTIWLRLLFTQLSDLATPLPRNTAVFRYHGVLISNRTSPLVPKTANRLVKHLSRADIDSCHAAVAAAAGTVDITTHLRHRLTYADLSQWNPAMHRAILAHGRVPTACDMWLNRFCWRLLTFPIIN